MENYADNLVENKYLRNDEEIILFEEAMAEIFKIKNEQALKTLFSGFQDETECEEVMFGLVHAVEDYEEYIAVFINVIPEILKDAYEWVIILIGRIMNDEESFNQFIKIASESDLETKGILLDLINHIKNDGYEKFGEKCELFIENVKMS